MRWFATHIGRGLGVVLGVLVATMAQGQRITVARQALPKQTPPKREAAKPSTHGSIHRIELLSGPNRSVRYVTAGDVPQNEREAAEELQRAENELLYVQNLERLKQQYVAGERESEPQRRAVQKQLYGSSTTTGQDLSNYGSRRRGFGYGGYGMYGGLGGGYGMLGAGGLGYGTGFSIMGGGYTMLGGYPLMGGYGGGYGRSNVARGYSGDAYRTQTRSLKEGVGDEGHFKDAMVQVIAKQADPEYATDALHHYEHALARAAASPMLAKALSLPKPSSGEAGELTYRRDSKVSIWVGNDKYTGIVKEDRPGWVVLETEEGDMSLRKSGIVRSQVFAEHDRTHHVSKHP